MSGARRPRVLQLAATDYAFRVHLLPLVRALHGLGLETICCGPPGPFVDEIRKKGFEYLEVPLYRSVSPVGMARGWTSLKKVLRRVRPDLLHTHTVIAGLIGRGTAHQAGTPRVVHTIHGLHNKSSLPLAARLNLAVERWGAKRSHFIFVQNEEDEKVVAGWGVLPPACIRNIRSGIDIEYFDPALVPAAARAALREELGIRPDAVVVTYVGRPTAAKGAADVLRLAHRSSLAKAGIVLLCVMPDVDNERGSIRPSFASATTEVPLIVLGMRSDVREILAISDIFLLPTYFEGMSKSIIEAMAMAKPVVSTNVRGCADLVAPGVSGFLAEPGDIDRLSRLLLRLAGDSNLRHSMGAEARRLASRHYDQARHLAAQTEVIRSLVEQS